MDMTEGEFREMMASLKEMFEEYLEEVEAEESIEYYGTRFDHADRELKKFLKWMEGPDGRETV
jgi:hypothetical protein